MGTTCDLFISKIAEKVTNPVSLTLGVKMQVNQQRLDKQKNDQQEHQ